MAKDEFKLQINSLDALNRLLGDDPALTAEIKDKVCDAFLDNIVKHRLPSAITLTKEADERIHKIVNDATAELFKQARDHWGSANKLTLTDDAKKLIRDQFQEEVDKAIQAATTAQYKAMADKIDSLFNYHKDRLQNYIEAKLNSLANEAIANKLASMMKPIVDMQKYFEAELAAKKTENQNRNITLTL